MPEWHTIEGSPIPVAPEPVEARQRQLYDNIFAAEMSARQNQVLQDYEPLNVIRAEVIAEGHLNRSHIVLGAIAFVAAGGGAYLYESGKRKLGLGIIVPEGFLLYPLVHPKIGNVTDRLRKSFRHKNT